MSDGALLRASGLIGRRTLIYLALALMTASWITGLLWAILGDTGPPLPVTLATVMLLVVGPLSLSRWLRRLELRREVHRGILALAFIFLALLIVSSGFYNNYGLFGGSWMSQVLEDDMSIEVFHNPVTSFTLAALCWWLGLTLGDMRLNSTNLARYFYASLAILLLPTVFFVSDVSQGPVWLFYVLLFAALVTLGLGRVEEVARRSQDRGSPFTLYWLAQLGLMSGLLLGIVALAQLLRLGHGVGLILVSVAPIVSALIFPLIYVGAKLITMTGFRLSAVVSESDPSSAAQIGLVPEPSAFQILCTGLLLLVLVFLVVFLIVFTSRRWRQMAEDTTEEERAALPSLGDRVSDAMEDGLARVGLRLPSLGRLQRHLPTRSIRRVYAATVALAAERGYPRPQARTPFEHLPTLRRAFPGCEQEVVLITEAYVAAHYGQVPDTREELQHIQAALARLRQTEGKTAPVPVPDAGPTETSDGRSV
jgi:hypothetical protein